MRALIVYLTDVAARITHPDTLAEVPVPDLPGSPTLSLQWQRQGTVVRWIHIRRAGGKGFWWRTMLDGADFGDASRMVGIAWPIDPADNQMLVDFAAATHGAWTLPELRADSRGMATAIKGAWKDERPRDENGDPVPLAEVVAIYTGIAGFLAERDQDAFPDLDSVR